MARNLIRAEFEQKFSRKFPAIQFPTTVATRNFSPPPPENRELFFAIRTHRDEFRFRNFDLRLAKTGARFAAELDDFLFPNRVVRVPRTDECVRNFVHDRVANFRRRIQFDQNSGKRNRPRRKIATAESPPRAVEFEIPFRELVFRKKFAREIFRVVEIQINFSKSAPRLPRNFPDRESRAPAFRSAFEVSSGYSPSSRLSI